MTRLELEPLPPRPPPPPPPAAAPAPDGEGSPWAWRAGCAAAGVLTLGVLFSSFNPTFGFFLKDRGFDAQRWPWLLFQDTNGGARLDWMPQQAYVLSLLLAGLCLLACSVMTRSLLRAALCVTSLVLVTAVVMPSSDEYMLLAAAQAGLALLAGGVLADGRGLEGTGARRAAGVGCMLLALFLVLPYPDDKQLALDNPLVDQPYESPLSVTFSDLARTVRGEMQAAVPGGGMRDVHLGDWAGAHLLDLPALLALLLGVLALLGRGGRWAGPALLVLLLVGTLGPCVMRALQEAAAYRSGMPDAEETVADLVAVHGRNATQAYLLGLRAACLPMALSVAELLRRR